MASVGGSPGGPQAEHPLRLSCSASTQGSQVDLSCLEEQRGAPLTKSKVPSGQKTDREPSGEERIGQLRLVEGCVWLVQGEWGRLPTGRRTWWAAAQQGMLGSSLGGHACVGPAGHARHQDLALCRAELNRLERGEDRTGQPVTPHSSTGCSSTAFRLRTCWLRGCSSTAGLSSARNQWS